MTGDLLVIDGHSDILMDVLERRLDGNDGSLARFHLPRLRQGGVDALFCPVAVDSPGRVGNDTSAAFDSLRQVREEVDSCGGEAVIATTADELRAAALAGKIALMLGLEGATPLGDTPETVWRFHREGIRWITLTWNGRNQVGDGVGVADARGLSDLGREHVRAMNEAGIVVDVSHAHRATLRDAVAASRAPVIASHSNARALCDHVRNLDDDLLRLVADSGGTVGVNFFPALIGPDPTAEDVAAQFAYLRDLLGVDAVAIGADYIDFALESMGPALAASTVDYGERLAYPDGVASAGELGNLFPALERRGLSAEAQRKIAGENLLRVLEAVRTVARGDHEHA